MTFVSSSKKTHQFSGSTNQYSDVAPLYRSQHTIYIDIYTVYQPVLRSSEQTELQQSQMQS